MRLIPKAYFRIVVWRVGRKLAKAGLARRVGFGKYEATEEGRKFLAQWPMPDDVR
jgi:hypothetical protein